MGLKPGFMVIANDANITADIAARFSSMTITDAVGFESDMLEIVITDDPQNPVALPPTGAELTVSIGYDGALTNMGVFVVDEIELNGWPANMVIRGRASVQTESKQGKTSLLTQKSRSWKEGTTIGDVVKKIASEHSMQPQVSDSLTSLKIPHTDQTDESDLSFLVRLSRRYDAVCKPAGGKLLFVKRGESDLQPITIMATQGSSYTMTLSRRESPGTVIAYWHSKKQAKKNEVKVGDGEPVRRLRHAYSDEATAKAAAQAELDARKRGEQKLSLTLPGDPSYSAEAPLITMGFRPDVDGDWLSCSVTHTIDKQTGYSSQIEAEKPNQSEEEN